MEHFKELNKHIMFICVSKYYTIKEIEKAYKNGFKNFGENKLQDLEFKAKYFNELLIEDINWHFIGRIQSNKIKKIVYYSKLIHSVSSKQHLQKIDSEAKKINKFQPILLQINLTNELSKDGFTYVEAKEILDCASQFPNVLFKGIMIIGPNTNNKEEISSTFKRGEVIFKEFKQLNNNISTLSMGMSNDYQIALSHNSNCIRIGSKFFEALNNNN